MIDFKKNASKILDYFDYCISRDFHNTSFIIYMLFVPFWIFGGLNYLFIFKFKSVLFSSLPICHNPFGDIVYFFSRTLYFVLTVIILAKCSFHSSCSKNCQQQVLSLPYRKRTLFLIDTITSAFEIIVSATLSLLVLILYLYVINAIFPQFDVFAYNEELHIFYFSVRYLAGALSIAALSKLIYIISNSILLPNLLVFGVLFIENSIEIETPMSFYLKSYEQFIESKPLSVQDFYFLICSIVLLLISYELIKE